MFGMSGKMILAALLLGGFFAIACFRAQAAGTPGQSATFSQLFHFSDRVDRLKRSRWQWFSMVALMLVLRLQGQLPLALEIVAIAQFVLFLALPTGAAAKRPSK